MCLAAIKENLIKVDAEHGIAYAKRFANRPMGCFNRKGYRVATLHYNGKRTQIKIHRLIWIAINGLIPEGYMIDHINGNKADNRISNLRLADALLNSQNRRSYRNENNPAARITKNIADAIRLLHQEVKSYRKVADRFGVSRSLVAQIVRGELWKC